MAAFFDRSRSTANPGFNRWLVPPAALCIHLCIGEAYAFSVFTKPMSQAIGITAPASADWSVPAIGWIFSIATLLTAWSAAGVLGPVLFNYIREYQIHHGVAKADAYSVTMYVMAGLLVVGLLCNLAVRPVDERRYLETHHAAD
ncbi:MAG TPA: hypothetical protein VIX83_02660 [Candidatus Cybelea sp.]